MEDGEPRVHSLSCADRGEGKALLWKRGLAKVGRVLARSVFWSYERGSWQYDLIVAAILAFIFLTPRSWFHDRPRLQLTDLRRAQGLVEVSRDKEGTRYLIDARLVESLEPDRPEEAIHEILRRRLKQPYVVKSMEVVRDKNNVMLGYSVFVEQQAPTTERRTQ